MKEKALLLGALPRAQEGPMVPFSDPGEWCVRPAHDYQGLVIFEMYNGVDAPPIWSEPVHGQEFNLGMGTGVPGRRARCVVTDNVPHVPFVSVELVRIK